MQSWQAESLAEDKAESMPRGTESDGADARSTAAEAEVVDDEAFDDAPDREETEKQNNKGKEMSIDEAIGDTRAEAQDKTKRSAEGPGQRKAQEDAEGAELAKLGKGWVEFCWRPLS